MSTYVHLFEQVLTYVDFPSISIIIIFSHILNFIFILFFNNKYAIVIECLNVNIS